MNARMTDKLKKKLYLISVKYQIIIKQGLFEVSSN